MNAFEAGDRKVIPAVLVYLRHGKRVLMIHRGGEKDFHAGKWNGLGGKLEPDESPLEAAVREVSEESGLMIASKELRPLATLTFPNFKPRKHEDWMVFVFSAEASDAQASAPLIHPPEGTLHWVDESEIPKLPLWPGDREFLPWVFAGKPFTGTIWYDADGNVSRTWLEPLG